MVVIDALMCCVGPEYAGYLAESLPIWLATLNSLTVVTKPDDEATIQLVAPTRARLITTDLFTAYGAHFNKGAALAHAFSFIKPRDWFLSIDADILPEPGWRKLAEPLLKRNCIHGAPRLWPSGAQILDPPPHPYGYFQLWHTSCPSSWRRPLWDVDWTHAGHYEIGLLDRWPKHYRKRLPIRLTHFGQVRNNWFADHPRARELMAQVRVVGFHHDRVFNNGRVHLPELPEEVVETVEPRTPVSDVLAMLDSYALPDPFCYRYEVVTARPPAAPRPRPATATLTAATRQEQQQQP